MLHILALVDPNAFSFDGRIGVGSVINALVILVGFVASWYKVQSKSENYEKDLADTVIVTKELSKQVQLLSLTIERLSTLSEINEKRWEKDSHTKN